METFIDLCAKDILQKHAQNLAKTTIIFPSKRAMVFFRKSLGQLIDKPIFMPRMTNIQDFCLTKQNATIPDDFTLVFLLYQSYAKISKTNETFDEFYPWGEMLLADFDDIDKYQINAHDIFTNIADIKEIDSVFDYLTDEQRNLIARFWDTTKIDRNTQSNDVRRKFIDFWKLLPLIYDDFQNTLSEKNFCYEGLAVRNVAEMNINQQDEIFRTDTYVFVGFNALSQCERTIFKKLHKRKQAYFYWDYDVYYKNDISHEAGIFIRKNLEQFPNELSADAFKNFANTKNINIIKTPNEIAQAKICGELLEQIPQNEKTSTAIILADENLIVPILKSIPENDKCNVTLGYPIRSSAAYSLFEAILDLCNNKKSDNIYYKDVFRICENPLLSEEMKIDAKKLRLFIQDNKKITISTKDCSEQTSLFDFIFLIDNKLDNYIESLLTCIQNIGAHLLLEPIDQSIFYTIFKELSALNSIVKNNQIQFQQLTFVNRLLKQSLQSKTIAIEGQPLEGLQVMGILETRMIDFKTIIVTSVTDENLPKTSTNSSFIPYNLRVAFGMPTIKEQSAMYSYYFYRMLQRSQNVTLLYSETAQETKSECSRFIMQLLYESPFSVNENTENPHKTLSGIFTEERGYKIAPPQPKIPQTVDKSTPKVQEYFQKIKTVSCISPSALYNYLECPMKFYLSKILNLNKPKDLSEVTESADIGNYFHKTIEFIYNDYIGKTIDSQTITTILSNEKFLREKITEAMQDCKASPNVQNPESMEFFQTYSFVKNFLEFDGKKAFKIIQNEKDVKTQLPDSGINIGGRIDRLDLQEGIFRIVDYKTSNAKDLQKKLSVKDFDQLFMLKNGEISHGVKDFPKEAFQTCMYTYILQQESDNQYVPHLIYVKNIKDESFETTIKIDNTEVKSCSEFSKEFGQRLAIILNDLTNPNKPFCKCENTQMTCKFCDFTDFCGVEVSNEQFS